MERWHASAGGEAIRDQDGILVAQFWTMPTGRQAALMVAAPELLSTLQAMVAFHDGEPDGTDPDLAAARSLLAKLEDQ